MVEGVITRGQYVHCFRPDDGRSGEVARPPAVCFDKAEDYAFGTLDLGPGFPFRVDVHDFVEEWVDFWAFVAGEETLGLSEADELYVHLFRLGDAALSSGDGSEIEG
jgi:hypothetical protein